MIISLQVLSLIANDCFRFGNFAVAFKSYYQLEKFSPSKEHSNGLVASGAALFFLFAKQKVEKERIFELVACLEDSLQSTNEGKAEKMQLLEGVLVYGKKVGLDLEQGLVN